MSDLVGTCPMWFWRDWLAEGDAAGDPETGEDWHWFTKSPLVKRIQPNDRFYVVAHGKLRGWAPVIRVDKSQNIIPVEFGIVRKGGAVAVTIPQVIPGFQGLRVRWWDRSSEIAFPDWKTP